MMKTKFTITLDKDIHLPLKRIALESSITLQELVSGVLRKYLERREKAA